MNYYRLTVYCMEGVFRSLFLDLVIDLGMIQADVLTVSIITNIISFFLFF